MNSFNRPNYADEYLELLFEYEKQLHEILEELKPILDSSHPLITKLNDLNTRISCSIESRIDRGQIPAPTE